MLKGFTECVTEHFSVLAGLNSVAETLCGVGFFESMFIGLCNIIIRKISSKNCFL